MKSKKGSAFGLAIVISLIVLAVGIIFFNSLFTPILNFITGGGGSSICPLTLSKGEGTARCPINEVTILTDKVEIDKKKFIERGDQETETMAKEAMAQLLNICFRNRGGGYNSNAFSREGFVSDEVVCLECFEISIDRNVGSIGSLIGYLSTTKVKVPGTDKTYLQILTRDEEHLKAYMEYGIVRGLAPSDGTFIFNPNKKYTIFFMGIKKGKIENIWEKIKNAANAEFLRLFFGNNDAYFAYIVESSRLSEVCDRKVN